MNRFAALMFCAPFLSAAVAKADSPVPARPEARRDTISLGDVSPTPEMWFYAQERNRYEDPKAAVRRNAEFDAAQRQARLASRRWFGYSNMRPTADPIPTMGDYSAGWTSNTYMPRQWSGGEGTDATFIFPNGGYSRYWR